MLRRCSWTVVWRHAMRRSDALQSCGVFLLRCRVNERTMTAQIALVIAIWRRRRKPDAFSYECLRTERCRELGITALSTPSLLHSAAKNEVDADPSKLIKLSAGPAALSSVSAVPISQPSLDYHRPSRIVCHSDLYASIPQI